MGVRDRRFGLATIVAVIVSMALSLVPIQPPVAEAQAGILPDLVTLEPSNLHITREMLDDGQSHYLLRFDNTVGNLGGPFEITAEIGFGNPIYQNVYSSLSGGSIVRTERVATDLIYHPTHNHFHLADFARYNLLKKDPTTGRYGITEFRGTKSSFCIIDLLRVAGSAPVDSSYQYCGETKQGLSHGWADIYDWQLPDQWIDLGTSPLPDGEYAIESFTDPYGKLFETDRSNNIGLHYFTISNGQIVGTGSQPDCFSSPSSAQVGATIQISCNRLDPGDVVDFRMDANTGPIIGSATVDSELKALLQLTLPEAPQGQHHIFANPRSGGGPYSTIVNIQPNLALGASAGPVGSSVPFTLTGFGSSETVSIRVNGAEVTQISMQPKGSASGSFVMPAAKNGANSVAAVGVSSGNSSTKQFSVQPSLVLGNNWVSAGLTLSNTLRGFGASETVDVTMSGVSSASGGSPEAVLPSAEGTVLRTFQVSATGSSDPGAGTDLTIPGGTAPGVYTITATGRTSGSSASSIVEVIAAGANTPTVTRTPTVTSTPTPTQTATPTRTPTRTLTPTRTATVPSTVIGIGSIVQTTGSASVRSGPCTSFGVIYTANSGTRFTVLTLGQACGEYTFIRVRETTGGSRPGTTGYLAAQNVQLIATATPTRTPTQPGPSRTPTATPTGPTSTPTPPGGWNAGDIVQTTTALNFREGPGTNYDVIQVLPSGATLLVTGTGQTGVGGFYIPVRYNGTNGWVASAYVTKVGTATATVTPSVSVTPSISVTPSVTRTLSTTPTPTLTRTVTNTPTASTTATATLTPTQSLTPTSTLTASVTLTATLSPTRTSTRTATPPNGFGPGDIVQVTEPLNMRATPGGTVLQVLPAGAQLLVTGTGVTSGQYFYIPVRYNGANGWVASNWVTKVGTATPTASPSITRTPTGTRTPSITPTSTTTSISSPTRTPSRTPSVTPVGGFGNGDIVRVTEALNLRPSPSLSGTPILVLNAGDQLLVTGTGVSAEGYFWIPVRYNGITNGWVVSQYVEKIGVATVVASTTPTRTPTRTVTPSVTTTGGPTFTPGPGGFLPGDTVHTRVRVNLREGPGTTNDVITVLSSGTELLVTGYGQTANGYYWLPVVTLGNTTGWIADDYVTAGVSPAAASTVTTVPTEAPTETAAPTEAQTETAEIVNPRYDDAVLRWLPEIEAGAINSGLTPAQVAALVAVMSGGDPSVTSSLGAVGLTQLKPDELAAAGIVDGYDPATNVSYGSALLAGMVDSAGSIEGGLALWFGDGCDENGACTADYIQSYLTAVASYEAILADPVAAGYVLLPADWVAPIISPYVGSVALRFEPVPPTEEPTIEVPPTEEPVIEPTATEEPTLEIPTDVPTEEPIETTPEEETA